MEGHWGARRKRRLALTIATIGLVALAALPEAAGAVLSGTNGRIVFASGRAPFDNANGKLYLRLTSGSLGGPPTTAPPLNTAAGQHRHPTWSPDRTKIAYARGGTNGCTPQCDIFILDLTDPNATPVNITNTAGTTEDRPAWSPDGTRIAFESGNPADILVDAEPFGSGTNLTLANAAAPEGKPAWSPDSQTLYYHRENRSLGMAPGILEGETTNIYKEPADNSGAPALAVSFVSGLHQFQPSISPDGSKICFTALPVAGAGGFSASDNIFVANLTTPPSAGNLVLANSGAGDYNCTWSPDGTQIAYVQGFGDPGVLEMKQADGSTGPVPIDLETANGWDGNPDWAPDARPQCQDQTINTVVNAPAQIPLLCADTGPGYEQTPVSAVVDDEPSNGTAGPDDPQALPASLTYTPTPGFRGTDTLTIQGFDAAGVGDREGTVRINVQPPSNEFTFGKVRRNTKRGTANLTVNLPGPGALSLATGDVKPFVTRATAAGDVVLPVKPKRKAKGKLAKTGKAKVKLSVSYTPDNGDQKTKSTKVKLRLTS
jgi:dipeptidyl aminopeptidase/acylaminoacyl peptidase